MSKGYEYNKKWRKANPTARQRGNNRYYAQTQGASNTGKWWTGKEDERCLSKDVTDRELSVELGRSVKAIQVRRARLTAAEKIEDIQP